MIIKQRTESRELLVMKSLDRRTNLSEQDEQQYYNLSKGYEGELLFDTYAEKLKLDCLILNDLLCKVGGSTFQIDSYFILSNKHRFYEIKNLEGDYYFEGNKFYYKNSRKEITNPLNQLSRTETLMRQLLHKLGFNVPVEGYLIFVNPTFVCYQSPLNNQIIFPNQIERHLKELDSIPTNVSIHQKRIADTLISKHLTENPYAELPEYTYDQLRKGIYCPTCQRFPMAVEGRKCICTRCGNVETPDSAVMRNIKEFTILFPREKITKGVIYDWCGGIVPDKAVRRILRENYKLVSNGRFTYYE